MTDDDLLAELRALGPDPIDPRLERLVEDPTLLATLQAEAEDDPALARDLALFALLDPAIDAQIAEQIIGRAAPALVEAPAPVEIASPAAVEPPRRRWLVATLAVAAALVLAFFTLRADPARAPATAWTLEALSGEMLHRDDSAPAPVHGPGSTIKLVLRPATPVSAPIKVSAWLAVGDAATRLDDSLVRTEANGASVFSAPVDALPPTPAGPQRLLFVISAPDTLPSARRVPVAELAEGGAWRVVPYAFERRSSP